LNGAEKELLEKTVQFLEYLGKQSKFLTPGEHRALLRKYGIGNIEALRRFWKFKKKQLEGLKIK
jgi:hypothetical protein